MRCCKTDESFSAFIALDEAQLHHDLAVDALDAEEALLGGGDDRVEVAELVACEERLSAIKRRSGVLGAGA